jgi:hypothetical protein
MLRVKKRLISGTHEKKNNFGFSKEKRNMKNVKLTFFINLV